MKIRTNGLKYAILATLITTYLIYGLLTSVFERLEESVFDDWWNIKILCDQDAIDQTETVVNKVKYGITKEYEEDLGRLSNDLQTIEEGNTLSLLLGQKIDGMSLNDAINTDSNDGFWATENMIIADLSKDCAIEFGTSRTQEQEISMHYNQELARKAIHNIVEGHTDSVIAWHYKSYHESENGNETEWADEIKNLEYVDKEVFKWLLLKYGTGEVFRRFEFLVPTFVYTDRDLLGEKYVHSSGHINTEARPLIYVQGYNLYDQANIKNSVYLLDKRLDKIKFYKRILSYSVFIFGILFSATLSAIDRRE